MALAPRQSDGDGQVAPALGGGGSAGGAFGEGGPGMGNVLSDRFLEVDEFAVMVEAEPERLTAELVDSGLAAELLGDRVDALPDSGLADRDVLDEEAEAIVDDLW